MIEQFLNHIKNKELCSLDGHILLAVSGGLDSMVMLHLFLEARIQVAVAHCNFNLRGAESDAEEQFLSEFCHARSIKFHSKKFNTVTYANATGTSIQIAARELRYDFFQNLLNEFGYDAVATAHHLDDSLETVLINLVRGTGLDGLTGIPVKNGRIIRPLLFATRAVILEYARKNNIQWKEDSSNDDDYYLRNILRHQIIPVLTKLNPNLQDGFSNTVLRLKGAKELADLAIDQFRNSACRQQGKIISIDIHSLKSHRYPQVLLWHLIKEEGFNFDQCISVFDDHQPGKVFFSKTHRLLVDREELILEPIGKMSHEEITITELQDEVRSGDLILRFREGHASDFDKSASSNLAQVDAAKISFPIIWRRWKHGDSFSPLGMVNNKKLSDFFIDQKIPLTRKEEVTVLESRGEIFWVVGLRISNSFKVEPATQKILIIEAIDNRQPTTDET